MYFSTAGSICLSLKLITGRFKTIPLVVKTSAELTIPEASNVSTKEYFCSSVACLTWISCSWVSKPRRTNSWPNLSGAVIWVAIFLPYLAPIDCIRNPVRLPKVGVHQEG